MCFQGRFPDSSSADREEEDHMLYEEMISGRIDIRPVQLQGKLRPRGAPPILILVCRFELGATGKKNYDYIHVVSDKI